MNGNIDLRLEQILATDSIEELEQLATDNGYDYKDEEQFLTDLAHHWKQLKQANTAVIKQIITDGEPLPTRVPSLDVVVNGKNVSIYGVIHHRLAGKHYFDIVRDTVNEKENWLMEDALPNIFGIKKEVIELPDLMATEAEIKQKYAINIESLVVLHLGSLIGGFLSGVTLPLHVYLRFRNAKRTRTILNEIAKISLFTPRYDTIILNEKYDKTFNIMFYHPFNLPSSISLELKQDLNLPLNSVLDLRSAYMAEFAREWKKEEDRNILVGAAHTPQIKYFLEKGVKDQRIVDLAHEHAALAKDDLDKLVHYHSSPTIKSNKLKQASAKATFYSGMGISLYGVYQLFS